MRATRLCPRFTALLLELALFGLLLINPCGAQLKSGSGSSMVVPEAQFDIQTVDAMVGDKQQAAAFSLLPTGTLASEEPGQMPAPAPSSPYAWRNWEDSVRCQPAFLAAPTSIDQVIAVVKGHQRVRAVGYGHSYNRMTCCFDAMIQMTHMDGVLELDTKHHTVTTQSGIRIRRLVDWLSDRGFALPILPFFIDQTIGGAISTASHGSSLSIGSLSSLVQQLKMVLADGTVITITEKDGDLLQAAKTSVGFLGVIVEVTLSVVKDEVVRRETTYIHDDDLLRDLKLAAVHALPFDTAQYWYSPPIKTAIKTRLAPLHGHHRHSEPDIGRGVSELYLRTIKSSPYERLFQHLQAHYMKNDSSTAATFNILWATVYSNLPGKYKLSAAWPVQQLAETDVLQQVYGKYDQYEWAVPLDKAHGCFKALFDMMDRNVTNRDDFLVPWCLRYVGPGKEGFFGQSYGGARFYLNLDSYYRTYRDGLSHSLQTIKDLMRSPTCRARMHFGKAGMFSRQGGAWTKEDAAYAEETYDPDATARFKQVLDTYDPTRKFGDIDNLFFH